MIRILAVNYSCDRSAVGAITRGQTRPNLGKIKILFPQENPIFHSCAKL